MVRGMPPTGPSEVLDLTVALDYGQFYLVVGQEGLTYESPTLAHQRIRVPAGSYAARITGRGFVNRLRLWPGPAAATPELPGY